MWTEYLNRLLGVTVGFVILATAVSAWRRHRRDLHILVPAISAVLLTGFQGWLGGRVVAHELASWIVTVHMLLALLIVSLLLYTTVYAAYAGRGVPVARARPVLAWTMTVLIAITVAQVVLGTSVRGGVDEALEAGVPRASALATVGWTDTWHRNAALVVLGAAMVALLVAWSRHRDDAVVVTWVRMVVAVAALQVGLGVVMAYVSLAPAVQVLHLTVASLLLGAETVAWLVIRWEGASDEARERPRFGVAG